MTAWFVGPRGHQVIPVRHELLLMQAVAERQQRDVNGNGADWAGGNRANRALRKAGADAIIQRR